MSKKKKNKKDMSYYLPNPDSMYDSQCEDDLLNGKIKIYEVPFRYRVRKAYIYACRYARGCNKDSRKLWGNC